MKRKLGQRSFAHSRERYGTRGVVPIVTFQAVGNLPVKFVEILNAALLVECREQIAGNKGQQLR